MSAPDDLAAYLDEAMSRALGNPPRDMASVASEQERVAPDDRAGLQGAAHRAANKLANNRAGHALRMATGTSVHLSNLRQDLETLKASHHRTWLVAQDLQMRSNTTRGEVEHAIGSLRAAIAGLELAVEELALEIERKSDGVAARAGSDERASAVDDMDTFYEELEARFRGDPEDIKQRLRQWLPFVDRLPERGAPVLDIGSGRGEWLSLLKDEGIEAIGVDMNARFADHSSSAGLDVIVADAFEYLAAMPENEVGALTAFQFIEHLKPMKLLEFLKLSYRVLKPGGAILVETPNPSNLRVAAMSFYSDPTHERPVHEAYLEFAVEYTGFENIERHYANPALDAPDLANELDSNATPQLAALVGHVQWALFGPQDYALTATKPKA